MQCSCVYHVVFFTFTFGWNERISKSHPSAAIYSSATRGLLRGRRLGNFQKSMPEEDKWVNNHFLSIVNAVNAVGVTFLDAGHLLNWPLPLILNQDPSIIRSFTPACTTPLLIFVAKWNFSYTLYNLQQTPLELFRHHWFKLVQANVK